MEAFVARDKAKSPAPRLKVSLKNGVAHMTPDHEEPAVAKALFMEALGTADPAFLDGLLGQLLNAGTQGQKADSKSLIYVISLVRGIEPRDELEAMLAAQMAAVHMAIMTFARRLSHVENIQQQDSAERAFNKLARTFAAQMEALRRYRTGGEQKVTVEHVTVNKGGQAIVGNVSRGPGGGGSE